MTGQVERLASSGARGLRLAVLMSASAAVIPAFAFSFQLSHATLGWFSSSGGMFAVILALCLVAYVATSGRKSIGAPTAWVCGLFAVAIIHSSVFSDASGTFHLLMIALPALYAALLAQDSRRHEIADILAKGIAAGGASLIFLAGVACTVPDILTPEEWTYRVPGFMNVRVVGQVAALGAMVALPMVILRPARVVWMAVALFCLLTVFWTGSRGGTLAIFVGVAVLLVALRRSLQRADLAGLLRAGLICGGAGGASLLLPRFTNSFSVFGRFQQAQASTASELTSGRIELWKAHLAAIIESPWAGNGFLQAQERGMTHVNAHNFVLDLLFGFGLPLGGLLTLAILFAVAVGLRRAAARNQREAAAHITIVAGVFAYAMLEPILFSPIPRSMFAFSLLTILTSQAISKSPGGDALDNKAKNLPHKAHSR